MRAVYEQAPNLSTTPAIALMLSIGEQSGEEFEWGKCDGFLAPFEHDSRICFPAICVRVVNRYNDRMSLWKRTRREADDRFRLTESETESKRSSVEPAVHSAAERAAEVDRSARGDDFEIIPASLRNDLHSTQTSGRLPGATLEWDFESERDGTHLLDSFVLQPSDVRDDRLRDYVIIDAPDGPTLDLIAERGAVSRRRAGTPPAAEEPPAEHAGLLTRGTVDIYPAEKREHVGNVDRASGTGGTGGTNASASSAASNAVDAGAAPQPTAPALTDAFRGRAGRQRTRAVRRALDEALDMWWSDNTLPDRALLRDGLLALEAGRRLSESSRSLLLHAALHEQRGIITALRHQHDPERTALLIKDAIIDRWRPLPPERITQMIEADEHSDIWLPQLRQLLIDEPAVIDGPRYKKIQAALRELDENGMRQVDPHLIHIVERATHGPRRSWAQMGVLWVLLVALVLTAVGQRLLANVSDQVSVPGGSYWISTVDTNGNATSALRTEAVSAFTIDRTEVTNSDYRACVEQGTCEPPAVQNAAADVAGRWRDPAFNEHPVVFVDQAAAQHYCEWRGQQLPSAAQWEVAAGYAPATERYYRFPWGTRFEADRANVSGSVREPGSTTVPVGLYQPGGNSALGAADMAGNVAEWTRTPSRALVSDETNASTFDGALGDASNGEFGSTVDSIVNSEAERYAVKGGSYRDGPAQLAVRASRLLPGDTLAPWLGFRCASGG